METVKILLIDDDIAFCELFKANLSQFDSGVELELSVASTADDPLVDANNQDIYLVDHRFHGRPMAPEIVKRIKKNGEGRIFVISKFGDFDLLKELLNLGISGFIDKDEIDYAEFLKFCESISQTKTSLEAITMKLNRLGD